MPFRPEVHTADNLQVFANLLVGANANRKERINAPNSANRFTTTTWALRRRARDSITRVATDILATFTASMTKGNIRAEDREAARDGIKRLYKSYKKENKTAQQIAIRMLIDDINRLILQAQGHPASMAWAQTALMHARNTRMLGSSNKRIVDRTRRIGGTEYTGVERQQAASRKLNEIRDGGLPRVAKNIMFEAEGIGNCGELSRFAGLYLLDQEVRTVGFASLASPGDHAFIVLGSSRLVKKCTLDPGVMSSWDCGEVWVCDPWANIACDATQYSIQFRLKCDKWHNDRKQVAYNGRWIDPSGRYRMSVATNRIKIKLMERNT